MVEAFAPYDLAFSKRMAGDTRAIAITPNLLRCRFDCSVGVRIVAQTRRCDRLWADHGCALSNQVPYFGDNFRGQTGVVGQHKHAIAHAVGENDESILDRHSVQNNVGVANIIVVTGRRRGAEMEASDSLGGAFPIEVTYIADELTLLQQRLAPCNIGDPGLAGHPPGIGPLEVQAPGAHGHAGHSIEIGLHGVAMKRVLVDTAAECVVAQHLERIRVIGPGSIIGSGRERFRGDVGLAVDVSCGGGFLVVGQSAWIADPKLPHRDVCIALTEQLVGYGGHTNPNGFRLELHAMSVGKRLY